MAEATKENNQLTDKELSETLRVAERLHKSVPYGDGLSAFDQVKRCAEIALNETGDLQLAKLALLSKSQKPKKVADGKTLPLNEIKELGDEKLVELVKLLGGEPSAAEKTDALWKAKIDWAKTLSPLAKQVLLIEKIVNFETSRDYPNPAWSSEKHADYIRTRMQIVEACKDANSKLYALACKTRDEALNALKNRAESTQTQAEATSAEQSWGDKFKKQFFNKITYVGVNYFVNAIGSATLAYVFKKNFEEKFKSFAKNIGEKYGSTERSKSKIAGGTYGAIEGLLLTSVGTLLVPVIKGMEDHRKRVQFRLGHWLDVLQEKMGRGNSATKENIADYTKVRQEMDHKGSVVFTSEEKERLWDKHRLEVGEESGDLAFKEHELPWTKVLFSRLIGWGAANLTSIGLRVSDRNVNEKMRYNHYESKAASWIARALNKVPGFNRIFPDKQLFGKLLLQDAIMTVSSSSTHAIVQGRLHKSNPAQQDEAEYNSRHRRIVAQGPKTLLSRSETRSSETAIAMQ